jgi:hypothetical protein
MKSKIVRCKSIKLVFRGFSVAPEEVEDLIGVKAVNLGHKGVPLTGGITPLKRSFVSYKVEFPEGCSLFEMLPALMNYIGGVENIYRVKNIIKPEFFEIDILLPIKGSKEQEGGFFELESIAALHKLGATLSFSFL